MHVVTRPTTEPPFALALLEANANGSTEYFYESWGWGRALQTLESQTMESALILWIRGHSECSPVGKEICSRTGGICHGITVPTNLHETVR